MRWIGIGLLVLLGACTEMSRDTMTAEGVSLRAIRHRVTDEDRQSPGAIRIDVSDVGGMFRGELQTRRLRREAARGYVKRFCQGEAELMDEGMVAMGNVTSYDFECHGQVL